MGLNYMIKRRSTLTNRKRLFTYILCLFILSHIMVHGTCLEKTSSQPIIITVPTPFFKELVRELASPYVTVNVLYPEGVEPHEYQLTPKEVEIASKSHIIVSTSHFPGEIKLEEMVMKGKIKAKLITLNDFLCYGLKLAVNPYTGKENLHAYWIDPSNTIAIARAIVEVLKDLDPKHANYYEVKFNEFKTKLEELTRTMINLVKAVDKHIKAVITLPAEQYIARWLGIDIVMFIVKEHGLSPTISDLEKLIGLARRREIDLILISDHIKDTKIGLFIRDVASRYGIPIAYVKVLHSEGMGIGELIAYNVASITSALTQGVKSSLTDIPLFKIYFYSILILFTIIIIEFGVILYLRRKLQLK